MTNNTQEEEIDLSILDAKDIAKLQAKKDRLDWVMNVIRESELENDKEFMDEIDPLIKALIHEKEEFDH